MCDRACFQLHTLTPSKRRKVFERVNKKKHHLSSNKNRSIILDKKYENFVIMARQQIQVTSVSNVQWINLNLLFCDPGFECPAQKLCIFIYIVIIIVPVFVIEQRKRTQMHKMRPAYAHKNISCPKIQLEQYKRIRDSESQTKKHSFQSVISQLLNMSINSSKIPSRLERKYHHT